MGIVDVPGLLPLGEQSLDVRRDGLAFFLHAGDGGFDAGGVPEFEGAEFPVEAEAHGAVDLNDGVGNLRHAVGGVGPEVGECGPEKCSGLVALLRAAAIEAEEGAKARARVFDGFRHVERGEFWLLAGMVFEHLPVESEALVFFAVGALRLLVEAAFGFVAQPLFLQHLAEELGEAQITAFVVDIGGHVADDVAEDVEADQIDGAEGGGLGPSHGLSGEGVDFFDGQSHFLHEADDVQHGEGADAVADEVGSVFGDDDALAETHVAEVSDGVDGGAVGLGRRDDFQQAHVARRVEEVRAKPGPAEVVGESFGNFADGEAAGVGGDDGARLADGFYFSQEGALQVEVFDDGLDDPVDVGEFLQVVFEIADGDESGERRFHEGGGLGFLGGVESGGGDFVAGGAIGVGRDDIEQVAGNAGVGEMRGDAGAHGSGAEDSDFIDALHN